MEAQAESLDTNDTPAFVAELADLMPVALGLIDAAGKVAWSNQACRELFRWGPSVPPGINLHDVLDPDSIGFAHDVAQRMAREVTDDVKVQVRLRRFDGTTFEANAHGRVVRYGPDRAVGMLGTFVPTAEAAYDNPFRRALDLQRELICEWSPGGTILFCNRAYRDFFGYGDEILGRNIDNYVKWGEGDSRARTMARLVGGETTVVALRTYDDGRSVEWANTLVRSHDGDPVSVLGVGRDITERLRAEEALRRSEERYRSMVLGDRRHDGTDPDTAG